jgi:hypothetical protein
MASERGRAATNIPPDLAVCSECRREIFDPARDVIVTHSPIAPFVVRDSRLSWRFRMSAK